MAGDQHAAEQRPMEPPLSWLWHTLKRCVWAWVSFTHARSKSSCEIECAPCRLAMSSAKMAVPAIIFLAMNLLSFVSLRRISASAFTLIQQSKIIFTAVRKA